jgi:hypothetical protein
MLPEHLLSLLCCLRSSTTDMFMLIRRSLLTILPQAFMQCSDSLRTQLDDATATASQRPDSLEGFIHWQSAMQNPTSASGSQRASCMQGRMLGTTTGRGSFCGGDAVRVGLLTEVEALRTLLDVLRCAVGGGGGGLSCVTEHAQATNACSVRIT